MAAITSTASGNASASSTWAGGVVPGNGDTVNLVNTVTVDVNTTWGASNGQYVSGGNPAAINIGGGGLLVLGTGVKLTCRGDFNISNGTSRSVWNWGPGSTFELDSSATSPTTTAYRVQNNSGDNSAYWITINGTQSQPCTFQSNAGGANGYVWRGNGTFAFNGLIANFCNFIRIGTGDTTPCWMVSFDTSSNRVPMSVSNCTFNACGQSTAYGNQPASGDTNTWSNVRFINTVARGNMDFPAHGSFSNVCFDMPLFQGFVGSISDFTNASFSTCLILNTVTGPGTNTVWSGMDNSYISFYNYTQSGSGVYMQGSITNSICMVDALTSNPHYILWPNAIEAAQVHYSGLIFEYTGLDDSGDSLHF